MDYPFIDAKSTERKAMLLSFLLHIFFLSIFIFTFRGPTTQPTSLLVFLGSILQSQDLLNIAQVHSNPNMIPGDLQLPAPVDRQSFTAIKKPSFSTASSRKKIPFKNTADIPPPQKVKDNVPSSYQPLKLYSQ